MVSMEALWTSQSIKLNRDAIDLAGSCKTSAAST
jgi:hypothetical protein